MKDKELRQTVQGLFKGIGYLLTFQCVPEENNLLVKDCPKCKHPVVALRTTETTPYHIKGEPARRGMITLDCYQCLSCGVKFTCSNKCVCEVIKEEK